MSTGKKTRMAKLFQKRSGKSLIIPMDHGATLGPIDGLTDIKDTVQRLVHDLDLVQGVVLHRGVLDMVSNTISAHILPPRILHVSASTSVSTHPTDKALVADIEDALCMNADAVSIHVNLGVDTESRMLKDFGDIASQCQRWGMPLLAMMYARIDGQVSARVREVKHAARLAAEMGADLVKVTYPGSAQAMQEVVDGCFIPVLIAGGEKCATTHDALEMVDQAMEGGAAGVCIGRNLFQQKNSHAFALAVGEAVHRDRNKVRSGHHGAASLAAA